MDTYYRLRSTLKAALPLFPDPSGELLLLSSFLQRDNERKNVTYFYNEIMNFTEYSNAPASAL